MKRKSSCEKLSDIDRLSRPVGTLLLFFRLKSSFKNFKGLATLAAQGFPSPKVERFTFLRWKNSLPNETMGGRIHRSRWKVSPPLGGKIHLPASVMSAFDRTPCGTRLGNRPDFYTSAKGGRIHLPIKGGENLDTPSTLGMISG